MKKFTGGLGDDDDRASGDKQVWKKYFSKSIKEAKLVVATRKVSCIRILLFARLTVVTMYIILV